LAIFYNHSDEGGFIKGENIFLYIRHDYLPTKNFTSLFVIYLTADI